MPAPNEGVPRAPWLTVEKLAVLVSLIGTACGVVYWLVLRWQEYDTQLIAGCTADVPICSEVVDGKSTPCYTILEYKAINPGPSVIENPALSISVRHPKDEAVEQWLEVHEIGPSEIELTQSGQRTVYRASLSSPGHTVAKLGPGAVFGALVICRKANWHPDEVHASWGEGRDIRADRKLRLEELFEPSWWSRRLPGVILAVSFPSLVFFLWRSWFLSRTSGEYRQLNDTLGQVQSDIVLIRTDVGRAVDGLSLAETPLKEHRQKQSAAAGGAPSRKKPPV